MNFTIKKDHHYSDGFLFKLFNLVSVSNRLEYIVEFDSSCIYDLISEDQYDINKLFGFSSGMHHVNSARFGWNWDGRHLHIYSYCYINKKRNISYICSIDLEKEYKFIILNKKTSYLFTIIDLETNKIYQTSITKQPTPLPGYQLWPYFGGNCKAPHDIKISLKNP